VIPTGQPFRSFLVEMMSPQEYPEVRTSPESADILLPYDVTAWTLPYQMGVESYPLTSPLPERCPLAPLDGPAWVAPGLVEGTGDSWALSPASNDSYTAILRLLREGATVHQSQRTFVQEGRSWPPGTFLVTADRERMEEALAGLRAQAFSVNRPGGAEAPARAPAEGPAEAPFRRLRLPRVGIYQSWLASMDEGWTRFVLDEFEFPVAPLHDKTIQGGDLARSFDVIILPDLTRTQLLEGRENSDEPRPEERRPEPYDGGLGNRGAKALEEFVREGGTLVTLGDAAGFAIEDLGIPVANTVDGLPRSDFSTLGAMLRVVVDTAHPLGYGMPAESIVYHTNGPVLGTRIPGPGHQRSVVARFADGDDVVASGWATGSRHLQRKAALVQVSLGEGWVVLFAFRPQHRGQTHGTYRMLFNAILAAAD
jgi:hypothetical protein